MCEIFIYSVILYIINFSGKPPYIIEFDSENFCLVGTLCFVDIQIGGSPEPVFNCIFKKIPACPLCESQITQIDVH